MKDILLHTYIHTYIDRISYDKKLNRVFTLIHNRMGEYFIE